MGRPREVHLRTQNLQSRMMPSIILGLSALLLGAAGQSQYRPGGGFGGNDGGSFSGASENSNNGDYLEYQEQAQYRPGGSSDYEYDYDNSITGDSSGAFGGNQEQQFGGSRGLLIQRDLLEMLALASVIIKHLPC